MPEAATRGFGSLHFSLPARSCGCRHRFLLINPGALGCNPTFLWYSNPQEMVFLKEQWMPNRDYINQASTQPNQGSAAADPNARSRGQIRTTRCKSIDYDILRDFPLHSQSSLIKVAKGSLAGIFEIRRQSKKPVDRIVFTYY
jgi:hypothetical protein